MTLQEALDYTKIRYDELPRINVSILEDIVKTECDRAAQFKYDKKLQRDAEAYSIILKEVK